MAANGWAMLCCLCCRHRGSPEYERSHWCPTLRSLCLGPENVVTTHNGRKEAEKQALHGPPVQSQRGDGQRICVSSPSRRASSPRKQNWARATQLSQQSKQNGHRI